jgi:hypothetical protein
MSHGVAPINSGGVQITGGSKPWSLHTVSILARKMAFAK